MSDERYEIRVLWAGAMELPAPAHFRGARYFEWARTAITVVLLRNRSRTVLLDTGVDDPQAYDAILRDAIGERAGFDPTVSMGMAEILAAADTGIEEIDFVVPTHLHWDHASNIGALPDAHLLFTRDAWTRVSRPAEPAVIDPGSYPPHVLEQVRTRLRSGRATLTPAGEILPGIWAERVGGHSPCSQLFAVRTRSGTVLLPVDNVGFFEHFEARIPPAIMYHLGEWYGVIDRVASEAGSYVPSHDPALFERFPEGKVA